MSDYSVAKVRFLEWLQEQGRERGYNPEISIGNKVIYERPRLLARTRGSVNQVGSFNFKVNDEVTFDPDRFKNVYSIILNLHDGRTWDPSKDSFYPLSLKQIKIAADREDINGDYPIRIDLSDRGIQHQKNRLKELFPTEDDLEREPPAERIQDNQTKKLNDIAKDL